MKKSTSLYLSIPLALLIGCSKGAESPVASSEAKPESATSSAAQPINSSQPAADPSTIPAELKNDSYKYYGLESTKEVQFERTQNNRTVVLKGTRTSKFIGMKDGVATFQQEYTGDLSDLGSVTLELRKDGLYLTESSLGQLSKPELQLPATVKIGDTWTGDSSIKAGTITVTTKETYKVEKMETIETSRGKEQALLVTAKGTMTRDGQVMQVEEKNWCVPGHGPAKMEVLYKNKDATTSMVIQEATGKH